MLAKSIVLLSTVALLLPMVFFMFASPPPVSRFRGLHVAGIVLNMAQLVVVVWGIAPMAAA
jgi:hypothetical protein